MRWLFAFFSIFFFVLCFGQKNIEALRIEKQINLNATFEERIWQEAKWTSDFTQLKPIPGNNPSKPTQVAILYDK